MYDSVCDEIKRVKERYNISLAQFGSMVGAPATSVKRWVEGVKPQKRFFFQILLVLGLINDPEEIYFDLLKQGIEINEKHWKSFASLIQSSESATEAAEEANLTSPDVSSALVSGVNGLLALIATVFASDSRLGAKAGEQLTTTIANILSEI